MFLIKLLHINFWQLLTPLLFLCRTFRRNTWAELTVDVHPDGLDGRWTQSVLGLAVIASALMSLDLHDVKGFVEYAGVLESVWHAACCLGPSNLHEKKITSISNHTISHITHHLEPNGALTEPYMHVNVAWTSAEAAMHVWCLWIIYIYEGVSRWNGLLETHFNLNFLNKHHR